jgi:hypothetical protein
MFANETTIRLSSKHDTTSLGTLTALSYVQIQDRKVFGITLNKT